MIYILAVVLHVCVNGGALCEDHIALAGYLSKAGCHAALEKVWENRDQLGATAVQCTAFDTKEAKP